MSIPSLIPESPTLSESSELSPEQIAHAESLFQSLLKDPSIQNRVEIIIESMENGSPKSLLLATLRRMENLEAQADSIRNQTGNKLDRLLERVDTSHVYTA